VIKRQKGKEVGLGKAAIMGAQAGRTETEDGTELENCGWGRVKKKQRELVYGNKECKGKSSNRNCIRKRKQN